MTPREMRDIFRRIGQDDILTVYDFFEAFTPAVFTNGWRNVEPTAETERRLARLPQFYADEASRRVCRAVTAWRYRRELVDDYPVGPEEDKYNLKLFGRAGDHYDVVYDCGSFDFSLVKCLSDADITFDRVIAFEPDPASYEVCRDQIAKWPVANVQVTLDRRAVSDRNGRAAFLASSLRSARLMDAPSFDHPDLTVVDTCTLDTIHDQEFGSDNAQCLRVMIKLHIEGAERAALIGAEKLIRRSRTDILLNISHDEISYLDIPEILAGFESHDVFLRSHSLFGEGLTVFARHRADRKHRPRET